MIGLITQTIEVSNLERKEIYLLDIRDLGMASYIWTIEKENDQLKQKFYVVDPAVKNKFIEALEKYKLPKIEIKVFNQRILETGEIKEGFEEIQEEIKKYIKTFELQHGGDRITFVMDGAIIGRLSLAGASYLGRKLFEYAEQGITQIQAIIVQEPAIQSPIPRIRYIWFLRD